MTMSSRLAKAVPSAFLMSSISSLRGALLGKLQSRCSALLGGRWRVRWIGWIYTTGESSRTSADPVEWSEARSNRFGVDSSAKTLERELQNARERTLPSYINNG